MSDHAHDSKSPVHGGGTHLRCAALPLCPGEPGHSEMERLRVARVLVYEDMVARTGKIRWRRLARWDYQPTDDEVTSAIERGLLGQPRSGRPRGPGR